MPGLTKVTSDVISTNTISGLISQGFTSVNVATVGTQTIEFGSSNTLVFRANTSTERMRIDTAGNLLLGTTTGFTSTIAAGALKMDGYGIYPYLNTSGVTNTAVVGGLIYQNSTPYSGDNGATGSTLVTALVQARLSNSGAGGTNSINIQAGNFGTVISNVGAAARISGIGLVGAGVRNISTDVSTDVNNQLYGVQGSATHNISAGAGIVSGVAIAGAFTATNSNGTTTTIEGVRAGVNIASATNSLSASATNVTGVRSIMTIGAASGGPGTVTNLFGIVTQGPTIGATGTVTNYYGLYLDSPTVTGTLTNRYGVYQVDASSPNYFAGNVGIGTVSPESKLHINHDGTALRITRGSSIGFLYNVGTASTDAFRIQSQSGSIDLYVGAAQPITFVTNTTERMRITSGGNVGIGTSSPAYKLDVAGGIALNEKSLVGDIGYFICGTNGFRWNNSTDFYNNVIMYDNGNTYFRNSISVGGVTPTTSGAGITFPATQSASSNANTLDDYEEGTWTPVLSRATSEPTITYGAREGKYTKIGNMVTVSISIQNITVSAAGSGNNRITGLPFAMSGQTYNFGGSLGFNDAFTNTVYAAMMDSNGSTSLFFRSGTGRSQSYDNGGWSSGGYLTLTFTYFTTT